MQFELKLADTGHSETLTLDKNARGQALFQLIAQEYKINYDEQFLLTRSGGRISPEVSLQKTLIEPVGNATITGKYNSKYSSQTKACLYLFNVKEMSKIVEPLEQNFRNKRKAQLNQQLELYNNLRPQVSSFESLQNLYPKEVLENYAKAYDQINDLKKYYQRLTNQYLVLKEIYRKIEILADQCENQRKSIRPLGAYVGNLAESLKVNAEHLANLKVNLKEKFSSEENSLNKNSKFFEINKQQDQIMRYHEGKINDLRGRMKSTLNELKNMVKYRQEAFKDCQNTILTFENKNYGKKLDQEIANGVKQYNKILSDFKNLVESQDYKYMNMIESAAQSQTKYAGEQIQHKYSELYGILVDYYVQVSRYNYNNIELVRSRFKEASRLKIAIDEFQQEVQEQKNY